MQKPHLVFEGDRFGRLTVIGFSHLDKRSRRFYRVRCDCGVEKTVQGTLLRSGNTKSCGCLTTEFGQRYRKANDGGVVTAIILQYKRHARERGIGWYLTDKEVDKLVRGE